MSLQKFGDWIARNKYPLVVIGFFLACGLLLWTFFKSTQKDHQLEIVNLKMQFKEEQRQEILKQRAVIEDSLKKYDQLILRFNSIDSALQQKLAVNVQASDQIKTVYHDKIKAVNNFSSADLQQFYGNLPDE